MKNQNDADIENMQSIKHVVIAALVSEKFITAEQANQFNSQYAVISIKTSWFEHIFKTLFNIDDYKEEGFYYKVIKFVGSANDSDKSFEIITDINELKDMLAEATNTEQFELAKKISERIKLLENKK